MIWERRNERLYVLQQDTPPQRGSLSIDRQGEQQRYGDGYGGVVDPWIDPTYANLSLEFSLSDLMLRTSLRLYDEEEIGQLISSLTGKIDSTISYSRSISGHSVGRIARLERGRQTAAGLGTPYEEAGYIIVRNTQRISNGPSVISPHAPITSEERTRIAPYIHGLAETLPELDPPFLSREHYAELLADF